MLSQDLSCPTVCHRPPSLPVKVEDLGFSNSPDQAFRVSSDLPEGFHNDLEKVTVSRTVLRMCSLCALQEADIHLILLHNSNGASEIPNCGNLVGAE